RKVEPVKGRPRIRVRCEPVYQYGMLQFEKSRGSNHIQFHQGDLRMRLATDMPINHFFDDIPHVLDKPIYLIQDMRNVIKKMIYGHVSSQTYTKISLMELYMVTTSAFFKLQHSVLIYGFAAYTYSWSPFYGFHFTDKNQRFEVAFVLFETWSKIRDFIRPFRRFDYGT